MEKKKVALVRYESPVESMRKAVALCGGFPGLSPQSRVFLKPNIVFWTKAVAFPKWGVITTSRIMEDVVVLLKEQGINDITIGEGTVTMNPKDKETMGHAFETLGYNTLNKRYGVKSINVFERPFEKIDLGDGLVLKANSDALHCDLIIDLPVLKTHNQAVVSLGIKNLKGLLDIASRKKCHSADPQRDLNSIIAQFPENFPPVFAILDGLFTNERGPSFDGKMRRMNVIVASSDLLSADMVGARVLGYEPSEVPHLVHSARRQGRAFDLSDVEIIGEELDTVAQRHEYDFAYSETEDGTMPVPLAKQGLKGLTYRKYDLTMCTYCSGINGLVLTAIRGAWKGQPWDEVEVLTGKMMKPTPGKKKTILIGQCIVEANKDNPDIQERIPVKGCPPKIEVLIEALKKAGIDVNTGLFEQVDQLPGFFMERYSGKPEFDENFFRVSA
jgi:uncharacterized protein (DUF362 family)